MLKNETLYGDPSLDKACSHVLEFWFPASEKHVERLRERVEAGEFDRSLASLVEEIKSDFSLFFYCVRAASALLANGGIFATDRPTDPVRLLENAGIEGLKWVINALPDKLSSHRFSDISAEQTEILNQALVSVAVTEELASGLGFDRKKGFGTALCRKLGYLLVAWNYPSIYKKALATTTADIDLETRIAQFLGFSPSMLAAKLLSQWLISSEMLYAVDPEYASRVVDSEEFAKVAQAGEKLTRLCEVGEIIASSSNSEIYPPSRESWDFAKREINRVLGPNGIKQVHKQLLRSARCYLAHMPQVFGSVLDIKDSLIPVLHNRFLAGCSDQLRYMLEALYSSLRPNAVSAENLNKLLKEIIPYAGFFGGLIYTYDPMREKLVAQSKIGKVLAMNAHVVDCKSPDSQSAVLVDAINKAGVVIENRISSNGQRIVTLSGLIGKIEHIGVLYLEMHYGTYSQDADQHSHHFEALRQSLKDCLSVS